MTDEQWDEFVASEREANAKPVDEHRETQENDARIEHRIWMRRDWWDAEPDRFSMQVKNAAGDPERFLVVSGNSTWLNLQQAKDARDYLDACIHNMATLGDAEESAREDMPRPRRERPPR